MDTNHAGAAYHIWGLDNVAYGPVDLPILVGWVKEERVLAETWVYLKDKQTWTKASELPELQMFFPATGPSLGGGSSTPASVKPSQAGISPGALRRIKILATMSDSELAKLIGYVEVKEFKAFSQVVR